MKAFFSLLFSSLLILLLATPSESACGKHRGRRAGGCSGGNSSCSSNSFSGYGMNSCATSGGSVPTTSYDYGTCTGSPCTGNCSGGQCSIAGPGCSCQQSTGNGFQWVHFSDDETQCALCCNGKQIGTWCHKRNCYFPKTGESKWGASCPCPCQPPEKPQKMLKN